MVSWHAYSRRMVALIILSGCMLNGCRTASHPYRTDAMFPDAVRSVYVQMFDNQTFRRGVEYTLTDALAKRIESETPYKIVASMDRADSIITGQITWIGETVLSTERSLSEPLEQQLEIVAVVTWKNLNTGELMLNRRSVSEGASYSSFQSQDLTYAYGIAANNLAERIVEVMETDW